MAIALRNASVLFQTAPAHIFLRQSDLCPVFEGIIFPLRRSVIPSDQLRPLDADRGIVPCDAAFVFGMVQIGTLITKFRFVRKDEKSVGKPLRYVKLFFVFGRQLHAEPFPVRLAPPTADRRRRRTLCRE